MRRLRSAHGAITVVVVALLAGCAGDGEQPVAEPAPVTTSPETGPSSTSSPTTEVTATTDARDADDAGTVAPTVAPGSTAPAPAEVATTAVDDDAAPAIEVTVPPVDVPVADPVALDEPAEFGDGVQIRIVEMTSAEVTSQLPGETGGPSVVVDLEFDNGSAHEIDLDLVTVDLVLADERSATPLTTEPADPVGGTLAAGAQRVGRYVFSVPTDERGTLEFRVRYAPDAPLVVLRGEGPTA